MPLNQPDRRYPYPCSRSGFSWPYARWSRLGTAVLVVASPVRALRRNGDGGSRYPNYES